METLAFYDYELFAVVNHEGQLNTGHYTNFARSQSEVCYTRISKTYSLTKYLKWYRFDDEK
jgi:ubiquitin carboxyl-terminal hydrolase 22/27/51